MMQQKYRLRKFTSSSCLLVQKLKANDQNLMDGCLMDNHALSPILYIFVFNYGVNKNMPIWI